MMWAFVTVVVEQQNAVFDSSKLTLNKTVLSQRVMSLSINHLSNLLVC